MNSIKNLTKENLHHAHLVISDIDLGVENLFDVLRDNLGVETSANEFFTFEKYDKFLVDDARKIFDIHLTKTPQDTIQVIVLAFNFITREAQNAILKMLEEPRPRTHFFIVAPSKNIFLETVISRVNIIEVDKSQISNSKSQKFLKMNMGERIKYIADLVKDIKDEKGQGVTNSAYAKSFGVTNFAYAKSFGVTKQEAIDLLSGLEVELESKKKFDSLKEIVEAKKYMNLSGASVKILLENVALNI